MKNIIKTIFSLIVIAILLFILSKIYGVYRKTNFNEFTKTERQLYTSQFERDSKEKFSNADSYKIISDNFNDAMFYKNLEVTKNTPYRVTCYVKTENIKTQKDISLAGANICIADTTEKSRSLIGTNDWTKLEFMFNSKNRTNVNIGFRLGTYNDKCTGIVWFSDFKVELGSNDTDNNWNIGCFIFENIDVNVNIGGSNQNVKLTMNFDDISKVKQNMERYKNSCRELSGNRMQVTYDIINIETPITTLSFDEENLYYVSNADVEKILFPYLQKTEYDYIFIVVRLGDIMKEVEIPVNDWVGLGGMDILGIGFSNIRLQNDTHSYMYTYNARINTFPEEVYLHEFLHTLERNLKEYDYSIPALHDYEKYGYKKESPIGLKTWYTDYMKKTIKSNTNENVGLDEIVYNIKPVQQSNFTYSLEIEFSKEPQNIIEEILVAVKSVTRVFNKEEKK